MNTGQYGRKSKLGKVSLKEEKVTSVYMHNRYKLKLPSNIFKCLKSYLRIYLSFGLILG